MLDVPRTSRIPESAVLVGEHLRARLRAIADGTDLIGEVRGLGLLAGVDLIAPTGQPERRFARSVLDGLVARGCLAGLTGPGGTVLEIRPPLIWRAEHADQFVDALAAALRDQRTSA